MRKNKQDLLKYLQSQNLMTLATYSRKPWVSTVYYSVDDNFNLYFLSESKSQHCQDISNNSSVACNIVDSRQKVTDKKVGVQVAGTAQQLRDEKMIKQALDKWNKANPGFEKIINFENIKKKVIHSKVYKVAPISIKFFSETLYGPEGFELFKF